MKIDIYTHIVPPKFKAALGKVAPQIEDHLGRVPTLFDMDRRFAILDKYTDMRQVLTLNKSAGAMFEDQKSGVDFARMANDEVAELVGKYPDRFAAGVASLPMTSMDAALKEADRAIQELGLKGIQLFTPIKDRPLEVQDFAPLFEKMSEYDLPIWVHPDRPIDRDDYRKFYLNHVFGWPYESTAAMTYLVLDGLFERFPGIKIIIHHCGALAPFFDQRIVEAYDASATIFAMDHRGKLGRHPVDYFKMFYTDTALSGGTIGLMCGHAFFGADHLLLGTDMPYDAELGDLMIRRTLLAVERMTVSDAEKKMIFGENAARLLGLKM